MQVSLSDLVLGKKNFITIRGAEENVGMMTFHCRNMIVSSMKLSYENGLKRVL